MSHVMRRAPSFLVIGAMKAGTTSLYHYLRAHSQVYMPALKEVDFFTEELNWQRGWSWYDRQFAGATDHHVALGEASTSYTKFPRYKDVPEKIARFLPEVKLVYVVRDPIERIRSHYQHNVTLGHERDPIDVAVKRDPAYLDYSRYALQIDRYLEHFPRARVLVIVSEDLRDARRETVDVVLRHIGADPSQPIPTLDQEFYKSEERAPYGPVVTMVRDALRKAFPSRSTLWRGTFLPEGLKRRLARAAPEGPSVHSIPPETQSWIRERLKDDVAELERYVTGDLGRWGIV